MANYMNFDNVGPYCKMHITCALHGMHGKRIKVGKFCRWQVSCTYCHWFAEHTFKAKPKTVKHFKMHKHDIEEAYPKVMQEAMANLRAEGLI